MGEEGREVRVTGDGQGSVEGLGHDGGEEGHAVLVVHPVGEPCDGQVAKVERGLAVLEQTDLVLSGPRNAAKIAAACALGYVDMRLPDLDWRASCPKLAAWFAEVSEMAPMKATAPVG